MSSCHHALCVISPCPVRFVWSSSLCFHSGCSRPHPEQLPVGMRANPESTCRSLCEGELEVSTFSICAHTEEAVNMETKQKITSWRLFWMFPQHLSPQEPPVNISALRVGTRFKEAFFFRYWVLIWCGKHEVDSGQGDREVRRSQA